MKTDPHKTTLNEHLNAKLNRDAGVVVHDSIEGELSLLYDATDNTVWLCWKENGSIYFEDNPNTVKEPA